MGTRPDVERWETLTMAGRADHRARGMLRRMEQEASRNSVDSATASMDVLLAIPATLARRPKQRWRGGASPASTLDASSRPVIRGLRNDRRDKDRNRAADRGCAQSDFRGSIEMTAGTSAQSFAICMNIQNWSDDAGFRPSLPQGISPPTGAWFCGRERQHRKFRRCRGSE
jgi:hypothetical protein